MRRTKQRDLILKILEKHKDHPSADTIYEEVRKEMPRISLGTVYRNLELMSESGSIIKIENGGAIKRFDPVTEPHPHFRCISCGAIDDVSPGIDYSEMKAGAETWAPGKTLLNVNIEYTGICESCLQKQSG